MPNSPQIEALYRVINAAAVHTVEIKDHSSLASTDDLHGYDAIVLSGSQRMLSDPGTIEYFSKEIDIIRAIEKPVLGICFGHQLLAVAFGEQVITMPQRCDGYFIVRRLSTGELFENIPEYFFVNQSHLEMVQETPYNFIKIAESPNCAIEAMKHNQLPVYGIQFHAERFDDKHPFGQVIIENFLGLATWFMK